MRVISNLNITTFYAYCEPKMHIQLHQKIRNLLCSHDAIVPIKIQHTCHSIKREMKPRISTTNEGQYKWYKVVHPSVSI